MPFPPRAVAEAIAVGAPLTPGTRVRIVNDLDDELAQARPEFIGRTGVVTEVSTWDSHHRYASILFDAPGAAEEVREEAAFRFWHLSRLDSDDDNVVVTP